MVSRTNYRRCMAEGWDGNIPVCEAQQCPIIDVDKHVQVNGDLEEATFGNVVRFSCKSSSKVLFGSAEIYCDENGEWVGTSPTCKVITCPQPGYLNAGIVGIDREEYEYMDKVKFICNNGYEEEFTVTCGDNACSNVKIPNGFVVPYNDTLYYTCEEGYKLPTKGWWAEAKCNDSVSSELKPCIAIAIPCSPPRKVENAVVVTAYQEEYLSDSKVTYKCRESYTAEGETTIRCIDERWEETRIVCTPLSCELPPAGGGFIVKGIPENDDPILPDRFLEFSCDGPGKYLHGSSMLICLKDGQWDNAFPTCEAPSGCGKPTPLEDGDIEGTVGHRYRHGDRVTYICPNYYKMEGDPHKTCTNGEWIGQMRCLKIICTAPEIENGEVREQIQEYKEHQVLEFQCDPLFTRVEARSPKCTKQGVRMEWSPTPLCELITCPQPGYLNAGIVGIDREEYEYMDKVKFICNNGYEEEFTVTCGDNGWSSGLQCRACSNVKIPNGFVVPYNDTLYYTCEEGYKLPTKGWWAEAKCNDSVSSELKPCIAIANPCSPPRKVQNAVVVTPYQEEYLSDSKVTYKCRESYTAEGETTIRCIDGRWEETRIVCTPLSCELPPAGGGFIVKGIPENDDPILPDRFLEFSCDGPGKYLHGSSMLICLKDGQWDNAFPTCEAPSGCGKPTPLKMETLRELLDTVITCPQPGYLNAGIVGIDREEYEYMDKVKFICNNGYEEEFTVTCGDNGWSSGLQCRACSNVKIPNGFVVPYNDTLYYTCEEGYKLPTKGWWAEAKCNDSVSSELKPCIALSCELPPAGGGFIVKGIPENDDPILPDRFLEFSCDGPGKYLHGSSMLICLKDGQWDNAFPTCEAPSGCGKPTPLEDGDIEGTVGHRTLHCDYPGHDYTSY
ncbi:hypothetical protein JOQ06_005861 [Pogonophryne albipinna]|uniref:Sushi domain-containing protein n=1 Tax=Pogonophryne albipinna TaxID=1090488 RepID=A0AAD6FRL9_9TELE|nr:hypothetical protein JOQ06_005861 [Pogonophryne albipinna]